jgi:hypothetical protein
LSSSRGDIHVLPYVVTLKFLRRGPGSKDKTI